jgi:hypothetical protein
MSRLSQEKNIDTDMNVLIQTNSNVSMTLVDLCDKIVKTRRHLQHNFDVCGCELARTHKAAVRDTVYFISTLGQYESQSTN